MVNPGSLDCRDTDLGTTDVAGAAVNRRTQ